VAKYGPRTGGPAAIVAKAYLEQTEHVQHLGRVILQLFAERDAALLALRMLIAHKEPV
jgi:hypothetical protein